MDRDSIVVVETIPGVYRVANRESVHYGGFGGGYPNRIIGRGQFCEYSHIIVTGRDISEEELSARVTDFVTDLQEKVSSNKGWALPKLDGLAGLLEKQDFVYHTSVVRR